MFLFKPALGLVAGHALLKPGFTHGKHSCVCYGWERFLSLRVFFCTFRSIATYVKKNNQQWRKGSPGQESQTGVTCSSCRGQFKNSLHTTSIINAQETVLSNRELKMPPKGETEEERSRCPHVTTEQGTQTEHLTAHKNFLPLLPHSIVYFKCYRNRGQGRSHL